MAANITFIYSQRLPSKPWAIKKGFPLRVSCFGGCVNTHWRVNPIIQPLDRMARLDESNIIQGLLPFGWHGALMLHNMSISEAWQSETTEWVPDVALIHPRLWKPVSQLLESHSDKQLIWRNWHIKCNSLMVRQNCDWEAMVSGGRLTRQLQRNLLHLSTRYRSHLLER